MGWGKKFSLVHVVRPLIIVGSWWLGQMTPSVPMVVDTLIRHYHDHQIQWNIIVGPQNTLRPITFEEFTTFIAQDISGQKSHTFQDIANELL